MSSSAFGDNGCVDFLLSDFDKAVNAASLFPGSFTYEKYFAGKYIGEIARRAMLKLADEGHLLKAPKLAEAEAVTAKHVSEVERDSLDGTDSFTKALFSDLGASEAPSEAHLRTVKYLCALLTHRCAVLVSVPLAVMISRLGGLRKRAKVAVTGSLYKYSPRNGRTGGER